VVRAARGRAATTYLARVVLVLALLTGASGALLRVEAAAPVCTDGTAVVKRSADLPGGGSFF